MKEKTQQPESGSTRVTSAPLQTGVNASEDRWHNVQANILKHHGREYAYHLFFKISGNKIKLAKNGLAELSESVTSAYKQLKDAHKRATNHTYDGNTVLTVSLSKTGFDKLGIKPIEKSDAFNKGMKSRSDVLSDNIAEWETGFKEDLDFLVIVADSNESRAINAKNKVIHQLSVFASLVVEQRGAVLRNEFGLGIEHFGYVDGISQPLYLDSEQTQTPPNEWNDNADINNLLVFNNGEILGSYLVFRKLEQNVKGFKSTEKAFAPVIKDVHGRQNDELTGAMIVGRFEDGTEVVRHSIEKGIESESEISNTFSYSDDKAGSKCPFHAHIRMTNPRNDIGTNTDPFSEAKSRRITRRGIPYNDIGRDIENLEDDQPENGVGLLFMCYQSSIETQFEFIQATWANKGNIKGKLVGIDGVIGQGDNKTLKQMPTQWGKNEPMTNLTFNGFVKMKGGEYFFTPTLQFLRDLAN